jgi:hypothetical protein
MTALGLALEHVIALERVTSYPDPRAFDEWPRECEE